MDAIRNVENEVDKVLHLFSGCKEDCSSRIEQLIETLQNARRDLDALTVPNQTELSGQQANIIQNTCDIIQKSLAQITNSHRELHVPVSRIGKSIDKNFNADFACASDASLFQSPENTELLNRAIVQYFLRHGMPGVAESLIKEAKLSIDAKELEKFDEVNAILTSLRKKDVRLALKWAVKNRKRLRELNSPLEFKIHRINLIELYRQGIDKQLEIIQYAREHLQHLDPVYHSDFRTLMGGILYLKAGIENSPYRSFLDPINYNEIEEVFVNNVCSLLDLSIRSPISVAVDAGCLALPALLEMNRELLTQGVRNVWQLRDELPVEVKLGNKLQFHSTFSCPILRQQSTESNPPMRLICGHVISREALHKLSGNSNANKYKCPYCPKEQVVSDAMQIYF